MLNLRSSVCVRAFTLLGLITSVAACVENDDAEPVGQAADALINGAPDGGYYPAVKINAKCTGTLVGPRTVVTANHCLAGRIGDQPGPNTVEARVRVRVMDPEWGFWYWTEEVVTVQGTGRSHPDQDVAVIILNQAISGGRFAQLASSTPVGASIVMVGYGRSSTSTNDFGRLRAGASTIESINGALFNTSSAPGAPTLCHGDSGGPSFLGGAGASCLVGVHHGASAFGCTAPGGTDVAAAGVAGWIRGQTTDSIGGC
jgi:secreted trypsin-like serine protease